LASQALELIKKHEVQRHLSSGLTSTTIISGGHTWQSVSPFAAFDKTTGSFTHAETGRKSTAIAAEYILLAIRPELR